MIKRIVFSFFICTGCISTFAVDVDFYGELGVGSWVTNRNYVKDDTLVNMNDTLIEDTIPQVFNTVMPVGKFGLKIKAERFSACVEFMVLKAIHDYADFHATGNMLPKNEKDYLHLRQWYGELYLGDYFAILAGKTYTPANLLRFSNQVMFDQNSFLNTGGLYTRRKPMLQFSVGNARTDAPLKFEIKAAGIKIDTAAISIMGESYPMINSSLPKFELGAGITYDNDLLSLLFKTGGGYVQYEFISRDASARVRNKVQAMVAGFELAAKVGPVRLSFCSHIDQNAASYGIYWYPQFVSMPALKTQLSEPLTIFFPYGKKMDSTGAWVGDIENSHSAAGGVVLRVELPGVMEWLALEAGYGIVRAWHEYDNAGGDAPFNENWHNINAFYANIEFDILECFKVTPEFGLYDYGPKWWYGRLIYGGLDARFYF